MTESVSSESERWMGMINRGGLWTINDQAYDIFLIVHDGLLCLELSCTVMSGTLTISCVMIKYVD